MHEHVPCTFMVDEGVANIVQYLLDEYTYSLLPFTSCENMLGEAFVGFVVRCGKDLRKLAGELPTYAKIKRQRNYPSHGIELNGYYLTWPATMNPEMNRWAVVKRFGRKWGMIEQ